MFVFLSTCKIFLRVLSKRWDSHVIAAGRSTLWNMATMSQYWEQYRGLSWKNPFNMTSICEPCVQMCEPCRPIRDGCSWDAVTETPTQHGLKRCFSNFAVWIGHISPVKMQTLKYRFSECGWGLKFSISNQLPGNANVDGPQPHSVARVLKLGCTLKNLGNFLKNICFYWL